MNKTRQYSLSEIESLELVASYEAEAELVDALHDRLRETESWVADLKKENVYLQNLLNTKRNGTA